MIPKGKLLRTVAAEFFKGWMPQLLPDQQHHITQQLENYWK